MPLLHRAASPPPVAGQVPVFDEQGRVVPTDPDTGTSASVDFDAGVVIEANDPGALTDGGAFHEGTLKPFDTVYDADYGATAPDPDVLPASLGLEWATDAAGGVLTATEDGVWMIGENIVFEQDADATSAYVEGIGASPVAAHYHWVEDISDADSAERSTNLTYLVRLRAGGQMRWQTKVEGSAVAGDHAFVTYAAISINRIA